MASNSEEKRLSDSEEKLSDSAEKKKLALRSFDGDVFKIEEDVVAKLSVTIKGMIDDGCCDNVIPLPNVDSPTLSKVIDYMNKHAEMENKVDDDRGKSLAGDHPNKWEKEFIDLDLDTLFNLIKAANYLEIKTLLDLTARTIADRIKGKSPAEIREIFGIENDFTPEEEAEIERENHWRLE